MYGGNYGQYGGGYGQYGGGYGQYGGGMGAAMQEMRSDMWINQNIPGGVNSKSFFDISYWNKIKTNRFFSSGVLGERLDNYLGGNPNPTYGQIYGGAPGYGGGYGYQSGRW